MFRDKKLSEITVLLLSTIKWTILSSVVGLAAGLLVSFFLNTLNYGISLSSRFPYYYFFLPFVFLVNTLIVKYIAPDAEGHGTEKVIEAIHRNSGRIRKKVIPAKFFTTILTLSFGGSVGKEGPCAQMGGGLASIISDILHLDDADRKKLVICGISAGFASVFGAPVAGAIFGIEVLYIGSIFYDALLPSLIAGIISYHICVSMGVSYQHYYVNFIPSLNTTLILKMLLAGIFFGLVSILMIEFMAIFKKISSKLNFLVRNFTGGISLIILTLLFSQQYLGLGVETIKNTLKGEYIVPYAFILKIVFTAITLNFGGSGGIILPLFFIGTTAGSAFSSFIGMDRALFSAIGMVSVLAGAANTPISASILAIEYFGADIASCAAISCIVSFLITGHRSVFPSQILGVRKTSSVEIEVGREIEKVSPSVSPRRKTLTHLFYEFFRKKNR